MPEAAISHLDIVNLPDAPPPVPEAVETAVSTMDGLLSDGRRPYVLVGGRVSAQGERPAPLTRPDRITLGEAAGSPC